MSPISVVPSSAADFSPATRAWLSERNTVGRRHAGASSSRSAKGCFEYICGGGRVRRGHGDYPAYDYPALRLSGLLLATRRPRGNLLWLRLGLRLGAFAGSGDR